MKKMKSFSSSPARHIPQRSCVGCGEVKPKRELVRLVRVSGGAVEVDIAGKKAGRGAYLCPSSPCWQAGLEKKRLEYVLRTTITEDNRKHLIKYGEELK